jgi:hypothetical protein
MKIVNVQWEDQEVYFTLKRYDGVIGEVQLNMGMLIVEDWMDCITWEGEEE